MKTDEVVESFCFVCGNKLVPYDESSFSIEYICPNCKFIFHLRLNCTMGNEIKYEPLELKEVREEFVTTAMAALYYLAKQFGEKK